MLSSIHIKKAKYGIVSHNSRVNFSQSVIFEDEENEIYCTSKEAYLIYRNELKERSKAYINRTNQKLQKNAITHLSAVVNLQQHHTLKNLEPIIKHLEDTLDTRVFQVAIHKDEGKLVLKKDESIILTSGNDFFRNPDDKKFYYDKKFTQEIDINEYEIIKNYHAHVEMMGLDSIGAGIKRNKLNTYYLSNLQTFVANILEMERGINYKKEEKKAPKRLDVAEFKRENTKKQKGYATQTLVVKEIELLRNEMKEVKAFQKEGYTKLFVLRKKLLAEAKAKELTIKQLQECISEHKKSIFKAIDKKIEILRKENKEHKKSIILQSGDITEIKRELRNKKEEVQYAKIDNTGLRNANYTLQKDLNDVKQKNEELQSLVYASDMYTTQNNEKATNKAVVKYLENKVEELEEENKELKSKESQVIKMEKSINMKLQEKIEEIETKTDNFELEVKQQVEQKLGMDMTFFNLSEIFNKLIVKVEDLSQKLIASFEKNKKLEADIERYKPYFDVECEKQSRKKAQDKENDDEDISYGIHP